MSHRIRAAALVIQDQKILLVKHVHPETGDAWWVPPGGGLEIHDESLRACACRETHEETGFIVDVSLEPRFVREFFDREQGVINIEFFFDARIIGGNMTMKYVMGNGVDEHYIKDLGGFSCEELRDMVVYPEVLKDRFGVHEKTIYLGRQEG